MCIVSTTFILIFDFFSPPPSSLEDALLCCEVVCRCVIKNGVLTRCEICLVGTRRMVCWVVGFVLFVLVGVLLLCIVVIMIFF